eukprot:COSAG01_NODE_519_length_16012_cov_4.344058_17_plen_134_part_00
MRAYFLLLSVFFFLDFNIGIHAYMSMPLTSIQDTKSLYGKQKPRSREQAVEYMQAFFIKKILTDPVFKKLEVFYDEDVDFIDASQSEMINDLLSKQMAEQLAKKDLLKFEERFIQKKRKRQVSRSPSRYSHLE